MQASRLFWRRLEIFVPLLAFSILSSCAPTTTSIAPAPAAASPAPTAGTTNAGSIPSLQPLPNSGYAQLQITLTVGSDPRQAITFNQCPDKQLLNVDWQKPLGEGDENDLVITATMPDGTSYTMHPIQGTYTTGMFGFGDSCSITINRLTYSSPLYYVNSYLGQPFNVSVAVTSVKQFNAATIKQAADLMSGAASLAKVPGALAATFNASFQGVMNSAMVSRSNTQSAQLSVQSIGEQPWSFTSDSLWSNNPAPINIVAALVPVATIFPDPISGDWTITDVTSASFPLDASGNPAPGKTFDNFFRAFASAALSNFNSQNTSNGASAACDSIVEKIDAINLSDRDHALVLWAYTHEHPTSLTWDDINALSCLQMVSKALPQSIKPTPPSPPAVPATVVSMKGAENDLADFFLAPTWNDRANSAATLFSYPMQFDDTNHLVFPTAGPLANDNAWLTLMPQKDMAILVRMGCYAYYPKSSQAALTQKYGGESFASAVGQLPGSGPEKDVAMLLHFGPVRQDGSAAVDHVEILSSFPADVKAQAATQLTPSTCQSGWKPALIFGPG